MKLDPGSAVPIRVLVSALGRAHTRHKSRNVDHAMAVHKITRIDRETRALASKFRRSGFCSCTVLVEDEDAASQLQWHVFLRSFGVELPLDALS